MSVEFKEINAVYGIASPWRILKITTDTAPTRSFCMCLDPPEVPVTGQLRYFYRVPVLHQGPRLVRNHLRRLRTCGHDESPSHLHSHVKCLAAHAAVPHGPHCGAGSDLPHQTCNEATLPSSFDSSSLGAIESSRIQRLPYNVAKHLTTEPELCLPLRKT